MNQSPGICLFLASLLVLGVAPAHAAEVPVSPTQADTVAGEPVFASHGLLLQLEKFLHRRELDAARLTADSMVGAMIDWVRFEPAAGIAGADALVFQYGGWSEGCATGFKFSLLRKVSGPDPSSENFAQTAGITLIFEPSANADLAPFKLVSSELNSIDAFMATIEGSPAFKKLASTTPMTVVVESGGMR